jgi:hypothetical protein
MLGVTEQPAAGIALGEKTFWFTDSRLCGGEFCKVKISKESV